MNKKENTPLEKHTELSQAIVFSTMALLAGGLIALIVFAKVSWVFPSLLYGALAYFAWDKFFNK